MNVSEIKELQSINDNCLNYYEIAEPYTEKNANHQFIHFLQKIVSQSKCRMVENADTNALKWIINTLKKLNGTVHQNVSGIFYMEWNDCHVNNECPHTKIADRPHKKTTTKNTVLHPHLTPVNMQIFKILCYTLYTFYMLPVVHLYTLSTDLCYLQKTCTERVGIDIHCLYLTLSCKVVHLYPRLTTCDCIVPICVSFYLHFPFACNFWS